ncbi:MAG: chemotaxis protein CheX [Phycisphaeraceae bacterium]|nr:chemotaxis protein CheX [Phycisphaeraceae bacterium]
MDAAYINPFIDATQRVFRSMLDLDVATGTPAMCRSLPQFDVSGIIGMSGDVIGCVVLSLPLTVARPVVGRLLGTEVSHTCEDFADAVGELVNMISGAAKAQFDGKEVSISCPSIIIGRGHHVARPSNTVCVSIPCEVYCGSFSVDLAIRPIAGPAEKPAPA